MGPSRRPETGNSKNDDAVGLKWSKRRRKEGQVDFATDLRDKLEHLMWNQQSRLQKELGAGHFAPTAYARFFPGSVNAAKLQQRIDSSASSTKNLPGRGRPQQELNRRRCEITPYLLKMGVSRAHIEWYMFSCNPEMLQQWDKKADIEESPTTSGNWKTRLASAIVRTPFFDHDLIKNYARQALDVVPDTSTQPKDEMNQIRLTKPKRQSGQGMAYSHSIDYDDTPILIEHIDPKPIATALIGMEATFVHFERAVGSSVGVATPHPSGLGIIVPLDREEASPMSFSISSPTSSSSAGATTTTTSKTRTATPTTSAGGNTTSSHDTPSGHLVLNIEDLGMMALYDMKNSPKVESGGRVNGNLGRENDSRHPACNITKSDADMDDPLEPFEPFDYLVCPDGTIRPLGRVYLAGHLEPKISCANESLGEYGNQEALVHAIGDVPYQSMNPFSKNDEGISSKITPGEMAMFRSQRRALNAIINDGWIAKCCHADPVDILEAYTIFKKQVHALILQERSFDVNSTTLTDSLKDQMRAARYIMQRLEVTPWFRSYMFVTLFHRIMDAKNPFLGQTSMRVTDWGDTSEKGLILSTVPHYMGRLAHLSIDTDPNYYEDEDNIGFRTNYTSTKRTPFEPPIEKTKIGETDCDIRAVTEDVLDSTLRALNLSDEDIDKGFENRWDKTFAIRFRASADDGNRVLGGSIFQYRRKEFLMPRGATPGRTPRNRITAQYGDTAGVEHMPFFQIFRDRATVVNRRIRTLVAGEWSRQPSNVFRRGKLRIEDQAKSTASMLSTKSFTDRPCYLFMERDDMQEDLVEITLARKNHRFGLYSEKSMSLATSTDVADRGGPSSEVASLKTESQLFEMLLATKKPLEKMKAITDLRRSRMTEAELCSAMLAGSKCTNDTCFKFHPAHLIRRAVLTVDHRAKTSIMSVEYVPE